MDKDQLSDLPCELARSDKVLLDMVVLYPFDIRFCWTERLELLQHFCVCLVFLIFSETVDADARAKFRRTCMSIPLEQSHQFDMLVPLLLRCIGF
jgi:hypothetical protein